MTSFEWRRQGGLGTTKRTKTSSLERRMDPEIKFQMVYTTQTDIFQIAFELGAILSYFICMTAFTPCIDDS